jgi:DNA-binding HxlR family transcriptional regulator
MKYLKNQIHMKCGQIQTLGFIEKQQYTRIVKEIIHKLNRQFENRVRLGIMSVLAVNDHVDFNTLKELLDVTDGNLASHLTALEKADMVEVRKQFIGRKPNTSYLITGNGKKAFNEHLNYLSQLVKSSKS